MVQKEDRNLQLHTNFGFGVGFNFRDDQLVISANNNTQVREGMVFHVRVAFNNVHPDPTRAVLGVGDTLVIKGNGIENLTSQVQIKYSEISYVLDDEPEEEVKVQKKEKKSPAKPAKSSNKKESSSEEFSDESDEESDDSGGSKDVMEAGLHIAPSLLTGRRALRSRAAEQHERQTEIEKRADH